MYIVFEINNPARFAAQAPSSSLTATKSHLGECCQDLSSITNNSRTLRQLQLLQVLTNREHPISTDTKQSPGLVALVVLLKAKFTPRAAHAPQTTPTEPFFCFLALLEICCLPHHFSPKEAFENQKPTLDDTRWILRLPCQKICCCFSQGIHLQLGYVCSVKMQNSCC